MADGLIEGFERRRLPGNGVEIDALVGGDGPPLLLLHGFPQTRMIWKPVAPALAERFTLVIPDLRGYGRSDKPVGDDAHELYSKRTMALDQASIMRALGHTTFAVAGHDRGARVAYRLALDHPDMVSHLAILDIVPTADTWAKADAGTAMGGYHWYMLAQPKPLPERLIGGAPDFFIQWTLKSWAGKGFRFDPENLNDYLSCFRHPDAIHGACEDYRAGWTCDRIADEADRGVRKIKAPVLVLWGEGAALGKTDPLEAWRGWANSVRGHGTPGGHFLCEEAPAEVIAALMDFLQPERS
jgi:haloacetate dehalogenase